MTSGSQRDLIEQLIARIKATTPEVSDAEIELIRTQTTYASAVAVAMSLGASLVGDLSQISTDTPQRRRPGGGRPGVGTPTVPTGPVDPAIVVVNQETGQTAVVDRNTGSVIQPGTDQFNQLFPELPPVPGETEQVPTEDFAGGFAGSTQPLTPFRPLVEDSRQYYVEFTPTGERIRSRTGLGPGAAPQYYEADAWRLFAGRSPEYIAQVKQAMIAAGLVKEDEAGPMGHWRVEDQQVMYSVLAEANASNKTWNEVLQTYAESNEPEDRARSWREANPFIAPVFRAPDYATLAQAVRQTMEGHLGRAPKEYELALLADTMRSDFNRAHAADVAAARATYEATARAVGSGAPQSPGTVQDVDPLARFQERFLGRYEAELDRREELEQSGVNISNLLASLGGLEAAVG